MTLKEVKEVMDSLLREKDKKNKAKKEAQFQDGMYMPEWQQKGLGKAIMARIMQEASHRPADQIIGLTASPIGFLLYSQFGFKHLFDYCIYHVPIDT